MKDEEWRLDSMNWETNRRWNESWFKMRKEESIESIWTWRFLAREESNQERGEDESEKARDSWWSETRNHPGREGFGSDTILNEMNWLN